jgi:hypothetical protein
MYQEQVERICLIFMGTNENWFSYGVAIIWCDYFDILTFLHNHKKKSSALVSLFPHVNDT